MAASIATLAACGGGGDSTPPPPPPPPAPAPTFTSATATATAYNAPVLVTVNGTNLDSTLAVTSAACSGMTRLTSGQNVSSSTTAYYNCTPAAYTGTVNIASASGAALGTASFSLTAPVVTSAFATATKYGAPALVTVVGTNLDGNGLTPVPTGCKNVSLVTQAPTVSSSTTAYYQCTVSGAYSGSVVLKDGFGAVLNSSATFTVAPPVVTMAVSGGGVSGNIVFALKGDKAPITVDNFLAYVNTGFYNGLIFHRVAPGFVVQGGGYGTTTSGTLPTPKTPTFAPIALETTGGSNVQWTVAMARTNQLDSATSQFFFNIANNASKLDAQGFAVFADVSGSAALVQQIAAATPCAPLDSFTDGSCVPIPNVVITSATQTQ